MSAKRGREGALNSSVTYCKEERNKMRKMPAKKLRAKFRKRAKDKRNKSKQAKTAPKLIEGKPIV
jgi:hypothetical protein